MKEKTTPKALLAKAIDNFNVERSKLPTDVAQLAWNLTMVQGLKGDLGGSHADKGMFYAFYEKLLNVIYNLYEYVDEFEKWLVSPRFPNGLESYIETATRVIPKEIDFFRRLFISDKFREACDDLAGKCKLLQLDLDQWKQAEENERRKSEYKSV